MKLYNGMGQEVTSDYIPRDVYEAAIAENDKLKAENFKLKRPKPTPRSD